jgi:tetratricopeptide (TPR) repeat protein
MVPGIGLDFRRIGGLCLLAILLFWQASPATALEAATAGSPQQTQAQSLAQQSRTQSAAKQWDEAIATAEKALAADAKSPAALIARGVARAGKGEFEAAIKDFDAVTGQAGRDPALVALRADAHVQRSKVQYAQGKYLPAIDSCYFAILEQNNSFDAHFNRGLAYLARHDYDKAIRSFDRAIQIVERAIEKYGAPVYVRHEIVHNRHVVERLERLGAVFVEELDECPTDRPVIFSAHGVPKAVPADAERREMLYVDATCPLVSKVHVEAERHFESGREIVLIGHSGHP